MKGEKIERGKVKVGELYEMEKVREEENVGEKYGEKVFELERIVREVGNKRIKM